MESSGYEEDVMCAYFCSPFLWQRFLLRIITSPFRVLWLFPNRMNIRKKIVIMDSANKNENWIERVTEMDIKKTYFSTHRQLASTFKTCLANETRVRTQICRYLLTKGFQAFQRLGYIGRWCIKVIQMRREFPLRFILLISSETFASRLKRLKTWIKLITWPDKQNTI